MLASEGLCAQRAARRSSSSPRDSTRGTSYPTVDTPSSSTDGRDGVYVLGTIERRSPTTSGASSTSVSARSPTPLKPCATPRPAESPARSSSSPRRRHIPRVENVSQDDPGLRTVRNPRQRPAPVAAENGGDSSRDRAAARRRRRRMIGPESRGRSVSFPIVGDLQIRAMSQEEFSSYRRRAISQYAAELVRAGASTAEQAEQQATTETDASLPDGTDTDGMALLIGESAGDVVGLVWVGPAPGGRAGWWIYDIEVVPAQRGRGYGRALLAAAEREAQRRGGASIGLNVFGGNDVALGMYESSGYEVAAIQMQKRFASSSGTG